MSAASAAGLLPLFRFARHPLAAQSGSGITPIAQAIGTVDCVNPIPGTGSLTEARIVQPVLMLMVVGHDFDGHVPAKPTLVGSCRVPVGKHTGELATINGRTYGFAARDPNAQQMDIFDITGLAN